MALLLPTGETSAGKEADAHAYTWPAPCRPSGSGGLF